MDPQFGTAIPPANGDAQPSPTVASTSTASAAQPAGTSAGPALSYADHYVDLAERLLNGYTRCEFTDFQLQFTHADGQQTVLALHAIIVSRSPLFLQLLRNLWANQSRPPVQPVLNMASPDSAVSASSLSLVIASLYSPAVLVHLDHKNAAAVLATAVFFGLNRLAELAFRLCEESVSKATSPEEIATWVEFVDREGVVPVHAVGSGLDSRSATPLPNGIAGLNGPGALSSPFGTAAPVAPNRLATAAPTSSSAAPSYEDRLRTLLLDRILRLPSELGAFAQGPPGPAQGQLVEVLKLLPFDLFKRIIEDSKFQVPSDMDRFNFAKKVVAARKQYFHATASPPGTPAANAAAPTEFEEAVVMQFGSGAGGPGSSAVNVLRKPRKPTLWKVSNAM
ncbi:hypothetical protein BMF94_0174 [Rhodotorula taiwanensis]|uniref:BTB domain-containing protein n=1 Tax=Rhodotorula taiwanensis TaxID=741276 RepID=A0A2S5BIK0_9BASI|nr:hypothetical protein BMF94_0174 [Rhodotorula taiwanensis]